MCEEGMEEEEGGKDGEETEQDVEEKEEEVDEEEEEDEEDGEEGKEGEEEEVGDGEIVIGTFPALYKSEVCITPSTDRNRTQDLLCGEHNRTGRDGSQFWDRELEREEQE